MPVSSFDASHETLIDVAVAPLVESPCGALGGLVSASLGGEGLDESRHGVVEAWIVAFFERLLAASYASTASE
jgi:hypothetical protein